MMGPSLIMRANINRQNTDKDKYGGKQPFWEYVKGDVHCYVFAKTLRGIADGKKLTVAEAIEGFFRFDEDVKAGDRLTDIVDRRGLEVFSGTLEVVWANIKRDLTGRKYIAAELQRAS